MAARPRRRRGRRRHAPLRVDDDGARRRRLRRRLASRWSCCAARAGRPEPDWIWADSLPAAAALLPSLGKRVFLTTGRTSLAAFAELDLEFLVRCVDPPTGPMPRRVHVLLDRGPFTVDGERALHARARRRRAGHEGQRRAR